MQDIDWIVLVATLAFIVIYGVFKTRGRKNVQDYIRGGNESKWWTVGLSVMATQASAITFLSTPGQAYNDGMGFVQFYFGLPIAMVIICLFFIPIYHRLNVYTAYEYLENRFDQRTRSLASGLFLLSRGLAAGITIFAPSIILSAVLGWDLNTLNIIIGSLVVIYTISGGTKAVTVTQKQQMAVIFLGMFVAFFLIISYLPQDINFANALEIAGASDKMNILDFSFDFDNRYTVWSGILGGTFLMLSYFGTDQSQVQRYLSGKSMREMQLGMIFNGILKVPMQFFILLVGVMVFVFYQFNPTPLNFNPAATQAVQGTPFEKEYNLLQNELNELRSDKSELSHKVVTAPESRISQKNGSEVSVAEALREINKKENAVREKARMVISQADKNVETNDKDYVFIHFILNNLPRGLIGLLLAVILSAAMSSTASELNALAATTTVDFYKRNLDEEKDEAHFVGATKWFTLSWGILAILIACTANLFDNLIQLVNIIGSIFYGTILGIFMSAFFIKKIKSKAVFTSALITQCVVILLFGLDYFELIRLPYLWLNFVGCGLVILLGLLVQTSMGSEEKQLTN
ncbi:MULTISPECIES: sodium:solute symporter [unclassified Leeuwenhoekiella]|uniref:sodium:solute symporter n=1 Tax=unclassified Leeuwenhoekiella TaxID=2615029 RepID=UPI000C4BE83A|nr:MULTISPECIES: sodium:solute symporter [unclassified Leeuwenhoekiella]MAW93689.1 sodium:solute symporter [Leeuwenhoekiella sp.]MBA83087.1 sodium:solute symporter [Leeuwenhoekiella sp.]|tara:strand:- start:77450 stop:79177 length:1728 start_codon:yes stop_codon:yes gene_type:complete